MGESERAMSLLVTAFEVGGGVSGEIPPVGELFLERGDAPGVFGVADEIVGHPRVLLEVVEFLTAVRIANVAPLLRTNRVILEAMGRNRGGVV